MNRKQLRERVRFLTLVEPHDVSDADLNALLDEGFNNVLTRAEWPWSINNVEIDVTAGDWSYDVGSEGWSKAATVVGVYHDDNKSHLRSMSVEKALRYYRDRTGRPEAFTVTHERQHFQITLLPIPDQDEKIWVVYRGGIHFSTGDGDQPPWHFAFHEMLADWAIYRVWEREEDMDKSEDYRNRFELRLIEMEQFYNVQSEDRPMIFGETQSAIPNRW